MTNLIRLFQDMTFNERKVKIKENKILIDKNYTPDFILGTSVFRERPKPFLIRLITFWKRPRNLLVLVDGASRAAQLLGDEENHPALAFSFGDRQDAERFLYKIVAKSKADQKPLSNFQFILLALLIGMVVVLQFMLMKGVQF